MKSHRDLDRLAQIQPGERDYYMDMRSTEWGASLSPARWTRKADPALHFLRTIAVHEDSDGSSSEVEELILPFPSAAIYGINRKAEYDKVLAHRPNMHSVRLLRRPKSSPIHRLFILHNGLNETDSLRFYYQLADWMMRQQELIDPREGVACLVMPFPGHLMHSSFHGPFSETPLSRYLNDAGDLFRQFLRYMVGMRWLLSITADSDAATWMVGGDLLPSSDQVSDLVEESAKLHDMSVLRIAGTEELMRQQAQRGETVETFDLGEKTLKDQVKAVRQVLRDSLERDSQDTPDSLRVHVAGYSLGGFVAQSVFFAWPQVVSSCTTICSGGAISALSPTAFAHPEEWQSVLHALRPETANSMLQGRLADDEREGANTQVPVETVAGMPLGQYGYFQRIFEQVFLQEDRGSYKERLSEYGLRMFFISGGEDPIVPPANILDASPREGTTMLTVAGMTHFLNQDPKDDGDRREGEQRDFWLPEAGGMIARAAINAEQVHMHEREQAAALRTRLVRPAHWTKDFGRQSASSLSDGYMFEAALDWVFDAVTKDDGWLFVCRNAIPAAFLRPAEFTRWGTGLHHHDLRVQRYALGLRHRRRILRRIKDRTTLIVPGQLSHWFVDLTARFEPHSDAPGGRVTDKRERRAIWRDFEKEWWPCIRHFHPGNLAEPTDPETVQDSNFADAVGAWTGAKQRYLEATHLPDVWIGIKADSELIGPTSRVRDRIHGEVIEGVEGVLSKGSSGRARKKLQDDLADGRIRIVQVSGAEFNPRYRGRLERGESAATRLLARTAAGLVRSSQVAQPIRGRRSAVIDQPGQ